MTSDPQENANASATAALTVRGKEPAALGPALRTEFLAPRKLVSRVLVLLMIGTGARLLFSTLVRVTGN